MAQDSASLVGRRSVLVSLGALAGMTAISGIATATVRATSSSNDSIDDATSTDAVDDVITETAPQRPQGTLLGLPAGAQLGSWTVEAVFPVTLGTIPVVLRTRSGDRFQVDVVRRDSDASAPAGVVNTRDYSVFVANCGDGSTSTLEEQGRGAMMVGRYLAVRERQVQPPAAMTTLAARNRAYPNGAFLV